MAKRDVPEINAGSMADIAFLLLIFFLVATTMDVDSGITRKLPPWVVDQAQDLRVKERNVLIVLINKDNQLAVEGNLTDPLNLKDITKEFYVNPADLENLSEGEMASHKLEKYIKANEEDNIRKYNRLIKEIGDVKISKGIVSLQNDRGTKYSKYIEIQNYLVASINELRDELAEKVYENKFNDCTEDQQELIQLVYPLSISEAEPKSFK